MSDQSKESEVEACRHPAVVTNPPTLELGICTVCKRFVSRDMVKPPVWGKWKVTPVIDYKGIHGKGSVTAVKEPEQQ